MKDAFYSVRPVGVVRSSLKRRKDCPKQGSEGGPEALLEIDPAFFDALGGLAAGQEILVLAWLYEAGRDQLKVHPRGNPDAPQQGAFSTRSPDRPNPIGLHRTEILELQKTGDIRVRPLEVMDGTPILDIKPILRDLAEE